MMGTKNRIVVEGEVARIITTRGDVFIVDAADAGRVAPYSWWNDGNGYACAWAMGRRIRLHNAIYGDVPDGYEVDHRNGDRADNRRRNLRIATQAENARNRKQRPSQTGCTGVYKHKNKFQARIMVDGKQRCIGTFDTIPEANSARIRAEQKHYGAYAPSLRRSGVGKDGRDV